MPPLGLRVSPTKNAASSLARNATVAAISARHRTEMLDETYGVVMDWGLGLVVDWYATGRYSSRRAFGHGGHQSSVAFCDPEHDLVVAVVCNGMPGRERHGESDESAGDQHPGDV